MADVYLLKFNNYYNRIIKNVTPSTDSPLSINDFIEAGGEMLYMIPSCNFIPNDGVSTTLVVNYNGTTNPDYIFVKNSDDTSSRWFVIDSVRTRKGQFQMTLKRDIITENYNLIIKSPVFIEKATLTRDNDLIFNNENMTYNQIKKDEFLLEDATKTPWIVGYMASNLTDLDPETHISGSFGYSNNADINLATVSHSNWQYASYTEANPATYIKHYKYSFATINPVGWLELTVRTFIFGENEDLVVKKTKTYSGNNALYVRPEKLLETDVKSWYNFTQLDSYVRQDTNAISETIRDDILTYDNKKVLFSDGLYSVRVRTVNSYSRDVSPEESSNIYLSLKNTTLAGLNNIDAHISDTKGNPYQYSIEADEIIIEMTKLADTSTSGSYNWSVPTSCNKLQDAPYIMFAIPLFTTKFSNTVTGSIINTTQDINLQLAMEMARNLNSILYDIQILPYCPLGLYATSANIISFTGSNNIDYSYVTKNNNNVGIIFFTKSSTFTKKIYKEIPVNNLKIENECDKYRICSPNYAGAFEFSAAKNDGVQYFQIECTYKPYNPYICVHPNWNRLYGGEYNDARGLICGGDFSLPIVTDAWKTYELQNKNYQNTFDRQIQNMEVNNSVQRTYELVDAITGSVQGAASGAMMGGLMGGGYGAAAGAIVGGVGSLIGGIADMELNEKLRNEAMDYTKDLFGYQLGNIKALPYSLAKVSSIVANSKFYPFIEYYTCSDVEKEALKEKIKYNGMTVMVIDKIENYIYSDPSYIKGKLIRLTDDANVDFHETIAIAEELYKGVYI